MERIQKKANDQPNAANIQAELKTVRKDTEDAEKTFAKVSAAVVQVSQKTAFTLYQLKMFNCLTI